jgi:uncharacterized protein YjbI with pentapeptide repeats
MNVEELLKRYAAGERDFNGCKDDVDLSKANLQGVDLSGAKLSCVNLSGANLSQVNLSQCDLSSTDFTGANLSQANLCAANLNDAYCDEANLNSANLSQANLEYAHLIGANLYQANLCNANLSNAYLESADFRNTDLRGANLEYADYNSSTLWSEDFNPEFYIGFWYNYQTFVKSDHIQYLEIARSFDSFCDAIIDIGYESFSDALIDSDDQDEDKYYSQRNSYQFHEFKLSLSDLTGLDWDYIEIKSSVINGKLSVRSEIIDILNRLKDAIYNGKVKLFLFLYT